MTDFQDRFGAQLVAAEERLAAPASPRRRRWRTRRVVALAFAALTIAVPALAATQPWEPILGDPAHDNAPAGISTTPAPNDQRGLLAVLRRPQTAADRGPIAEHLLASVGTEYKGVRLSPIRLLTPAGGQHALLVPA